MRVFLDPLRKLALTSYSTASPLVPFDVSLSRRTSAPRFPSDYQEEPVLSALVVHGPDP